MYELIKSIANSRMVTAVPCAIKNAPIDGNRYVAWSAMEYNDDGSDISRVYLYDNLDQYRLKRVMSSERVLHYELNSVKSFGMDNQVDLAETFRREVYDQLDLINPQWPYDQWAVPNDGRDVCLYRVKTDSGFAHTELVLTSSELGVFNTAFCIERVKDNQYGQAPDLRNIAKSDYDGVKLPRFAVLYGDAIDKDGTSTELKLFLFDRAAADHLYMHKSVTDGSYEVFVTPISQMGRVYTNDKELIESTVREHLLPSNLCRNGGVDYEPIELVKATENMDGVETARLYLDI